MAQLIKIGTRGSQLALWQANWVAERLQQAGFETEVVSIETTGDKNIHRNIAKLGVKGVFTDEIEKQLRNKEVHIAVHSAKDMQSNIDEDLEIFAFTEREKPNDVLVSYNKYFAFDESQKIVLGTSSARRVAMIRHYFPKVKTSDIRGNLQTRMRKLEEGLCDALVLARAGVKRLGWEKHIVQELDIETFTPAVGQGSLAIECLTSLDAALKTDLRGLLNEANAEVCLKAERAFLKHLDGGCSVPIFALAQLQEDGQLFMNAGIVSLNGKDMVRKQSVTNPKDPVAFGQQIAQEVLEDGGRDILDEIRKNI